ncbi:MAG TPA: tyrosine-type recombinase/integrase [Streptosporangiaceae bacterium]
MGFRAERAVSPSDGAVAWVVVDDDYELHEAGCAFLAGLRGGDRSVNTERLYAGRVALFLSWCAGEGVEWRQVRLDQMVAFKRWLVAEAPAGGPGRGVTRRRSPATADAVLGTVCEFFRFCTRHGLVAPAVAAVLYEPRFLRFLPRGYEAGEDGQFRTVRSRLLRYAVAEKPFEFLDPDRVGELVAATGNTRDRFLVALVAATGMRIGEALGLHRQDMHLLADSRSLGCAVAGPHVHVRRRADNPNGALAKSRFPRTIPVPAEVAALYAAYWHERYERLGTGEANPLVFVNLYRPPLGGALKYHSVKEMFDRLAQATGLTVRPHLLRHTAATTWLRQGTPRDTVQALLGHGSPVSMQPYLHPGEAGKRAAVEQGAAWVRTQR